MPTLLVSKVTPTTALLKWSPPGVANGPITNYSIYQNLSMLDTVSTLSFIEVILLPIVTFHSN